MRRLGELVPRTDRQAVVAAIDAVAHGGAVGQRPWRPELDRQVRQAFARVQLVGRDKGLGRADVEAGRARAAMIDLGRIGSDHLFRQDDAEKQPRTEVARHQVGMLALPAQPGQLPQRLFHQRRGVDEDLDVAAGFRRHPPGQQFQLALDDFVIIVATGIDRDVAGIGLARQVEGIVLGAVIVAQDQRALRFGPHPPWMLAAVKRLLHPRHVAVETGLDEDLQALGRLPDLGQGGEARDGKAQLAGFRPDHVGNGGGCRQKSSSL